LRVSATNKRGLLSLLLLLGLFFDPGTQFPGNEKKYAMQYKNIQKLSWFIIIIVIIINDFV